MPRTADIRRIAILQRQLIWVVVLYVLLYTPALLLVLPRFPLQLVAMPLILFNVVGLVLAVRMVLAMGVHWAWMIPLGAALLVPLLGLLVLLVVQNQATLLLKARGLRPGLMGVPPDELAILNANACQRCGYDLTGLEAVRCPECGAHEPLKVVTARL